MNVNEAEELSRRLMKEYGLIEKGWTFLFDNASRRFGLCDYDRQRIQLAKPLVEINPFKAVDNTIRHEIAHALVGPYHGHDEIWRAKAIQIGCDGKRCHNDLLPIHNVAFIGICPKCYTLRPSKKQPTKFTACAVCCKKYNNSRFSSEFAFQWKPKGTPFDVSLPGDFLPADKIVSYLHISPDITNSQSVNWCLNRFALPIEFFVQTEYATAQLTRMWAKEKQMRTILVNGFYAAYPKSLKPFAATLFNREACEIVGKTDLLFAIWDGSNSDCRNLIMQNIKRNRPTIVFNFGKKKITSFHLESNSLLSTFKII